MKTAVVIKGDGIGPEIADAALHVLNEIGADDRIRLMVADAGSEWWEEHGGDSFIPPETWTALENSDSCLKAPVRTLYGPGTPRSAVVAIRRRFGLYVNVRPIRSFRGRPGPLGMVEHVYVRENTEGLYSGIEYRITPDVAITVRKITRSASLRVAEKAFEIAKSLGWRKVFVVHKATVIKETDGLFLEAVEEVSDGYPRIELEDVIVDNMAQQLVLNPHQFDRSVIVGPNLYLDILSEESAALVGGVALVHSANIGDDYAMFEPAHGSAPSLRGKGIANPIAIMMASAAMLEYLGEIELSRAMVEGVERVIEEGRVLTPDMGGSARTMDVAGEIAKKSLEALASI